MQNQRLQSPAPPVRPGPQDDIAVSDENLAAAFRAAAGGDGEARPLAVLLARHWQAVFDYASIGTPSPVAASMLTTAAFGRVLEKLRKSHVTAALRPLLMVTARQLGRSWASDPGVTALPGLQHPETGRAVPAALFAVPENRALSARAFLALTGASQCLLWHVEVEGEDISVPADLLAVDTRAAASQLEHARELLRVGVLRSHLELAPDKDCRHYNRLLDVGTRRGGTLIPDIQVHLATCRHCRFAAEQLDHDGERISQFVAEGLLGEAAQPYLDSRPSRRHTRFQAKGAGGTGGGGLPGRRQRKKRAAKLPAGALPGGRRNTRRGRAAVATGLGVVAGVLVVTTVVTRLWADDGGVPSGARPVPGASFSTHGPGGPDDTDTGPGGPVTTHFRSAEGGLCLDVRDRRMRAGAETVMASCAGAPTQTWTHEADGLLRSASAPQLCLNSHQLDGVLVLWPCGDSPVDAQDVRYDLTADGALVPHWNRQLAVVPSSAEAGASAVVKVRDGSDAQSWETDPTAVPRPRPGDGNGEGGANAEVNATREAPPGTPGPGVTGDPADEDPTGAQNQAPGTPGDAARSERADRDRDGGSRGTDVRSVSAEGGDGDLRDRDEYAGNGAGLANGDTEDEVPARGRESGEPEDEPGVTGAPERPGAEDRAGRGTGRDGRLAAAKAAPGAERKAHHPTAFSAAAA
jgi:hypothetical protein